MDDRWGCSLWVVGKDGDGRAGRHPAWKSPHPVSQQVLASFSAVPGRAPEGEARWVAGLWRGLPVLVAITCIRVQLTGKGSRETPWAASERSREMDSPGSPSPYFAEERSGKMTDLREEERVATVHQRGRCRPQPGSSCSHYWGAAVEVPPWISLGFAQIISPCSPLFLSMCSSFRASPRGVQPPVNAVKVFGSQCSCLKPELMLLAKARYLCRWRCPRNEARPAVGEVTGLAQTSCPGMTRATWT